MYKIVKTVLSLITAISCLRSSPVIYAEETASPEPVTQESSASAESYRENSAEESTGFSEDVQETVPLGLTDGSASEEENIEVEPVIQPTVDPYDGETASESGTDSASSESNEVAPMIQPNSDVEDSTNSEAEIDFSSCRLLVADDEGIENDPHVISSYNGLYLLQYETESETQSAYYEFLGTDAFVDIDTSVTAANDESDSPASDITITEEENPLTAAKDEESVDPPAEESDERPLIYLIDSGVNSNYSVVSSMSVIGEDPSDDNGHGTRMYDLIRQQDPDASIVSIKALDANGHGTISSVAAAMRYAIDNHADIINLSLSAPATSDNSALLSLITEAHEAGIAVVGAAGNSGKNVKYFVPGSSSDAIIISACDNNGVLLSTSNYGDTVYASIEAASTSEAAAIMTGLLSINCRERGRFFEWDQRPSIVHYPAEPHGDMSGCTFTDGLFDAAACPYVHNWSNEDIIVTNQGVVTDKGKELFNTNTVGHVPYNNTEMVFNGSGKLYIYASDGTTVKQSWTLTANSGSAVQHNRVNDRGGTMTVWIPNAGTYQGKQFAISLKVTLMSSEGFVSGQIVPGLLELSVGARAGKTDLIDVYVENGSLYKIEETFYTGNITEALNSGTVLSIEEGNHMLFGALNASNENRSDNSWAQNIEFIGGKKGSTIYVQNYQQNVAVTNDSNQTHVNDPDFYAVYPYDCAAHNDISVSALFDQKDENGKVPLTLTSYVGNMGLWNGGYSWSGWGRTFLHGQDSTIWFQCYTRPFYGAPSELTPKKQVLDEEGNDINWQKVQGGDSLDYLVSITNQSSHNEYAITVSDPLPLDVDLDTERGAYNGSDSEFSYNSDTRTITWKSTKLAPGETKNYHLYVTVVDFPETESIDNTAYVHVTLKGWTYDEPTNTVHNIPSKEKFHGFFVHWLELNDANGDGIEDTPDDYSDNKVLSRMYSDKHLGKGEAYRVTAPDLDSIGYRIVDNQIVDDQCTLTRSNPIVSGIMPAEVYELYVYYVPHSLTINYREAGTETILWSTHKDITIGKGDAYSVESPVIKGYTLNKKGDQTVSGVMSSDIYEYDVYYTRDAMIGSQVSVTKSSLPLSGDFVEPGDTITYTLTARNTGVNTGTNIHISDPIPVGVTYVSAADNGVYNQSTNTVEWTLPSLAAGAEHEFSWTAKVEAGFDNVVYDVGYWTYAEDPVNHETNLTVHPVSRDLAPDISGEQIGPAAMNITKGQNDAITDREFNYTGNVQAFTIQASGLYHVTLKGASGGGYRPDSGLDSGGYGGVVTGDVYFDEGTTIYVYVGGTTNSGNGGWNGGGSSSSGGHGGGGATDIRISGGTWNNAAGLENRIMVAGGGGGADDTTEDEKRQGAHGGNGGGYSGGAGQDAGGGTQTSGNAFGYGGNSRNLDGGGGGGGWYGGRGSASINGGGGGGSGYLSGWENCAASATGYTVQNGNISAGTNWGNGYARVTLVASPSSSDTASSSSSSSATVSASSVITYKIFARNDGTATAHNIVLVDPIPTGTTLISPGDGAYNKTLNRVEWVIANMQPGEYVSKEFTVAVTESMEKVPTIIANQVDYARDIDPNTSNTVKNLKNKTNIVEYKTGGQLSVLIVNTVLDDPAYEQGGHEFTYVITGPNGSSRTVNIPKGANSNTFRVEGMGNGTYTITQQPDSMYELYNGVANKNSSFNKSTWVGSFTFSDSSKVSELTFFDRIEDPFFGNAPKKQVVNNKGEDINEHYVANRDILTYIITFHNPTQRTIVYNIEDALPQYTSFVSADKGGRNENGTVKWSGISVAGGATGSVSTKVKAGCNGNEITTIKNVGKVSALKFSSLTNEVSNYVVPAKPGKVNFVKTVTETAKLSSKDFNALYVRKGDVLYYHITTSSLPKETDFVLTDTIPDGMEYVSGSADNSGTYDEASHTVTWNLHITEASSLTVTFAVKAVVDSGDFDNSAFLHIGSGVGESNHVVNEAALLKINKQITNALAAYGTPSFVYKIVGSDGTSSYRMVQIADAKDNAEGTTSFAVPTGTAEGVTYEIAELKNARYQLESVSSHSSNVEKVSDNLFRFSPKKGDRSAELNYKNTIQKWNKISHEDSVINHVPNDF